MAKVDSLPTAEITIDEQFFVRFRHGAPQKNPAPWRSPALQSAGVSERPAKFRSAPTSRAIATACSRLLAPELPQRRLYVTSHRMTARNSVEAISFVEIFLAEDPRMLFSRSRGPPQAGLGGGSTVAGLLPLAAPQQCRVMKRTSAHASRQWPARTAVFAEGGSRRKASPKCAAPSATIADVIRVV